MNELKQIAKENGWKIDYAQKKGLGFSKAGLSMEMCRESITAKHVWRVSVCIPKQNILDHDGLKRGDAMLLAKQILEG